MPEGYKRTNDAFPILPGEKNLKSVCVVRVASVPHPRSSTKSLVFEDDPSYHHNSSVPSANDLGRRLHMSDVRLSVNVWRYLQDTPFCSLCLIIILLLPICSAARLAVRCCSLPPFRAFRLFGPDDGCIVVRCALCGATCSAFFGCLLHSPSQYPFPLTQSLQCRRSHGIPLAWLATRLTALA